MSKIIIIDDEQSICDLLTTLFTKSGYETCSFTEPEKAIEGLYSQRPDCAILDIKMPKIGGIDVLAKIRDFDPTIKVVMITGFGTLENAMEAMKLGAYDYITKPFDLEFIKTVVKNAINDRNEEKNN